MYRSAECGLGKSSLTRHWRKRDGGLDGAREAYRRWSCREATNGHEAAAASGEIATARTAGRARAAVDGGGELGQRSKRSRASTMATAGRDVKSGSGSEMFDGWRFGSETGGVGWKSIRRWRGHMIGSTGARAHLRGGSTAGVQRARALKSPQGESAASECRSPRHG